MKKYEFKFNYGLFKNGHEETWSLAVCEISENVLKEIIAHIKGGDHSGLTRNLPEKIYARLEDAAQEDSATLDEDMVYAAPDYEKVLPAYLPIELINLLPEDVQVLLPKEAFEQPKPRVNNGDDEWEPEETEPEKAKKQVKAKKEKKHDNKGLKTLTLSLKQIYFDQILAGMKKQEYREIRPTTEKKLILMDEEGFAVEDKERYVYLDGDMLIPSNADGTALKFNLEGIEGNYPIKTLKDDDGEDYQVVVFDGEEFLCYPAADDNEEPLVTDEGEPIYAVVLKLYNSIPVKYDAIRFYTGQMNGERDTALVCVVGAHTEFICDEEGIPLSYVIGMDDNGEPITYYAEQVVYDLGEIIEKTIYPKK